MARYDKYDGVTGGCRVPLSADATPAQFDKVLGCGLNALGTLVLGAPANTGFVGVTIVDRTKRRAGDVQDVMRSGEIVNCAGLVAGTTYYLSAAGELTATAPAAGANAMKVGHTVEADRLVVFCERVQG